MACGCVKPGKATKHKSATAESAPCSFLGRKNRASNSDLLQTKRIFFSLQTTGCIKSSGKDRAHEVGFKLQLCCVLWIVVFILILLGQFSWGKACAESRWSEPCFVEFSRQGMMLAFLSVS